MQYLCTYILGKANREFTPRHLMYCAYILQLSGDASYEKPPSHLAFDHVAKRQRHEKTTQASNQPAIHVHIPERLISSETRTPLSDHQSPAALLPETIDLTRSDDSEDDLIAYPSTLDFLTNLNAARPLCDYLQYHNKLVQHGIVYVDSLLKLDPTFFSDVIGIPVHEVSAFLGYAKKVIRRAERGKMKGKTYTHHACAIKKEDFDEEDINSNKENLKENIECGQERGVSARGDD